MFQSVLNEVSVAVSVNGVFHGKGVLGDSDGKMITGNCYQILYQGKGKLIYPNGQIREGKFLNGQFLRTEKLILLSGEILG